MKQLVEFLINNKSTGIIKVNDEFVDLGLSVLWGTCNLGANNPEDPGMYFQWGSTDGHYKDDGFVFANSSLNSKYNKQDSLRELEPSDDPASKMFGGNVHTPSMKQMFELMNKTKMTFDTNKNVVKLTSKIYKTKSIIIPLGGLFEFTSDTLAQQNIEGHLWTSSAWSTFMPMQGKFYLTTKEHKLYQINREAGLNIRPVKEP